MTRKEVRAGAAQVDVWTIALDRPDAAVDLLSPDERARAARFRFERDRRRYVAAHAAMRRILAAVANMAPASLDFETGPQGKPALRGLPALHFNLSHSGELAVLAVTTQGPVGVDVEAAEPIRDFDAVAEAHFSSAELAALRRLPSAEQHDGFYRLWTRKEAYIKAIGIGLSHPLDRFTVTIDADAARFVEIDGDPARAAAWGLATLPLPGSYVGAVAIEAPTVAVTLRASES